MLKKTPFVILILGFSVASWLLVHVLAVLGVFIAFAIPIWWLISPNTTICFYCRSKRDGEWCNLCKKRVSMSDGTYPHPKNLRSALLNSLIVLLFTMISAGVVFVESKLLFKVGFPPTPKTVSFVIPSKRQYRLGEIFPVKLEIVGMKTPINAVQADLGFDPERLKVLNISTQDSFANVFLQKDISNETGYVRLTGGLPNPGFSGDVGVFGTVYFRGDVPGITKIDYLPTSMVLANDSYGTNVLKEYPTISYLILPERITTEEEEMQKKLITMEPNVLGAKSEGQLIFYDNNGVVLGLNLDENLKPQINVSVDETTVSKDASWIFKPSNILKFVDTFIVNSWMMFIKLVSSPFTKTEV
jgi:hypothetical protein